MSLLLDIARAAAGANVLLLLALGYVWGTNYLRIRSKQTLGTLTFVVFLLGTQFVWNLLIRLGAVTPTLYSPVRIAVLLSGIGLAGWLAYFNGLGRLRGKSA